MNKILILHSQKPLSNGSVHVLVDEGLFDVEQVSTALHTAVFNFTGYTLAMSRTSVQIIPGKVRYYLSRSTYYIALLFILIEQLTYLLSEACLWQLKWSSERNANLAQHSTKI